MTFSNMYCSDSEDEAHGGFYASEHPCDADLDSGYDSDSFYDEFGSNPYEPTCGLVGRSKSEAQSAHRVTPPPLVVLTSMKTERDTGYSTLKDYCEERERKIQEHEHAERKVENKIKVQVQEQEQARVVAIMASLPTESKMGKHKRVLKERVERQLKAKLDWLARKKKRKAGSKSLPFGHRRNGGGKRRSKMVQHGTKQAERVKEVIRARRATKKKERKEQKKHEEAKRQEEFKMAPPKVVEVVTQNYECEEDELAYKLVRAHVVKNFDNFSLYLKPNKSKSANKCKVPEAPWTQVKKKKKSPVVIIKLVTPKLIEEEKIEEGRDNLRAAARGACTKKMRTHLTRSKMCRSVGTGRGCPHGAKCRFAHNVDELKVAVCFFKDACRYVMKTVEGYKNCRGRKCKHLHPGESMKNYCKRLRLGGHREQVKQQVCLPCRPRPRPATTTKVGPPPKVNPWKLRATVKAETKTAVEQPWTTVQPRKARAKKARKARARKPRARKPRAKKPMPICRSVGTGRPCPHGDKCRFRHK